MTVSTLDRVAGPFDGNDLATNFPFTFKVLDAAAFQIIYTDSIGAEVIKVKDVDYTLNLNADQDNSPGGSIDYPISGDPLATGDKLTGVRVTSSLQGVDLTNQGPYNPNTVETMVDRSRLLFQEVKEELTRTIKVAVSSDETPEGLVAAIYQAVSDAAASAAAAAASYDSFDDRYLGVKASAPTLDNDGNALLTGALYWNTTTNKMYVWSGSAWGAINLGLGIDDNASSTVLTLTGTTTATINKALLVGEEDVSSGSITLYGAGPGSNEGGQLNLYNAADYDTNFNLWYIDVHQEELRFRGAVSSLTLNGVSGDAYFIGHVNVLDTKRLEVGSLSGGDLYLLHDGVNSAIVNKTGQLSIYNQLNSGLIYMNSSNSVGVNTTCAIFGGATPKVKLNYNAAFSAETMTNGLAIGSGAYLQATHNATDGRLNNTVGNLGYEVPTTKAHQFKVNAVEEANISASGLTVGTPTGGPPGSGKINAEDLQINGASVSATAPVSGSFTPTIQDASFSDAEGQTYTHQYGSYVKIGKMVLFTLDLHISSLGTLTTTGSAYIGGLPYAGISTYVSGGGAVGGATSASLATAGTTLSWTIAVSSTRLALRRWDSTAGTTQADIQDLTATSRLFISGVYETAA